MLSGIQKSGVKGQILSDSTYRKCLESQIQRLEVAWWMAGGWGKEGRLLFNGYNIPAWDEEKVLELDVGDGYTTAGRTLKNGKSAKSYV